MKTFEELFAELTAKAKAGDSASGTVQEIAKGVHFIGKKLVEEASESWMAAEYEGDERTAEELKIAIGGAMPRREQMYLDITGRNLISGLPKLMRITSDEIYEAIDDPLTALIEAIHSVLEHTPAELAADVFDAGIVLTGGGAQLANLSEAVTSALKVDCRVAENPHACVAMGCGRTLENLEDYGRYLSDRR